MRRVPHVDLANGFVRIADELLEVTYRAQLSGNELSVFLALIRETYGKNKKQCIWSYRIAADETDISRNCCETAWKSLVAKNLVTCWEAPRGSRAGQWGPNKHYRTWRGLPQSFYARYHFATPQAESQNEKCSTPSCGVTKREEKDPQRSHKRVQTESQKGPNGVTKGSKRSHNDPQDPFQEALSEGSKTRQDKDNIHLPPPPPCNMERSKNRTTREEEEEELFTWLPEEARAKYLGGGLKRLRRVSRATISPKCLRELKVYLSSLPPKAPDSKSSAISWAKTLIRCLDEGATATFPDIKSGKVFDPHAVVIKKAYQRLALLDEDGDDE